MAAVTAVVTRRRPIGNKMLVTGTVASLTAAGGHVAKLKTEVAFVSMVLGASAARTALSTGWVGAARNSTTNTADASAGDLFLDTGATADVQFAFLGR